MFEKTLFGDLFRYIAKFDGLKDYHQDGSRRLNEKVLDGKESKRELIWVNIISIGLLHVLTVYAFLAIIFGSEKPHWATLLWTLLHGVLGGLGVTAGAHRLFSHKSYKATTVFKIFILYCYTLAGQNSVYDWVRDHRVHHKFSETDADPHNANRGFFFSHVGWLMMRKHPDVIKKGKTVDMSDISDDPIIAFHTKYFIPLKIAFAFVIPTIVPIVYWGESPKISFFLLDLIRYTALLNATWSVNSVAHIWGNRPYDKRIQPTENIYVSFCAMGEGWHNYHHVFPWDYRAAEFGTHSSTTTNFIDFAAKLGLVYERKAPSKTLVLNTIKRHGDGSWTLHQPQEYDELNQSEQNDSIAREQINDSTASY